MKSLLLATALMCSTSIFASEADSRCLSTHNGVSAEELSDGSVAFKSFDYGLYLKKPSQMTLVVQAGDVILESDITDNAQTILFRGMFLTRFVASMDAEHFQAGDEISFKFVTVTEGEEVTYPSYGWYIHSIPYGLCSSTSR